MKKIVTFYIDENGRKKITSISAPLLEEEIDIAFLNTDMYGIIDSSFQNPPFLENKKTELYFDDTTNTVIVEYLDMTYNDLSPSEKLEYLEQENSQLKSELELTQAAIFEIYESLQ